MVKGHVVVSLAYCVHNFTSCVYWDVNPASLSHLPTPLYVALVILHAVQKLSKTSKLALVAIYVSILIAIALLYFKCKSCMATIKHKETILM